MAIYSYPCLHRSGDNGDGLQWYVVVVTVAIVVIENSSCLVMRLGWMVGRCGVPQCVVGPWRWNLWWLLSFGQRMCGPVCERGEDLFGETFFFNGEDLLSLANVVPRRLKKGW